MYWVNKVVGALVNPVYAGLIVLAVAFACTLVRRRKAAKWLLGVTLGWLWLCSMPATTRMLGVTLERGCLLDGSVPSIGSYPESDAIELHGGSMWIETNLNNMAEMSGSADRVWMAARLWKAGKAPIIYVTGTGCTESSAGLLSDFGIPTNALVFANGPRNTEEEARFIADAMKRVSSDKCKVINEGGASATSHFSLLTSHSKPKVLVVTSAWHMKRTMLMYEKYAPGVEAIPAPCDFENSMMTFGPLSICDFLPNQNALALNTVTLHEWVGIWGYKLFR